VATFSVAICSYFSLATNAIQFQVLALTSLVQFGLIAWVGFSKHFDNLTLRQVVLSVSLLCTVGLFSSPILEDDHFRYLWDGYVTATTGRPYLYPPSHFFGLGQVSEAMQELLSGINHPDIVTVYGPLLQVIFAVGYLIAPAKLWPLKLLLALLLVQIIWTLGKLKVPPKWLFAFCLHPLLIKESVLTAHPDLLIGAFILGATLLWRRDQLRWAAIAIAAAAAIKVTAVVLLVFVCLDKHGKFCWPAFIYGSIALVIGHLPMIVEHMFSTSSGLSAFSQQWVFNPLGFRLFSYLVGDQLARILVVLIFLLCVFVMFTKQRRHGQVHLSITGAMIAMLVLAPVLNPWYWLWVLPLAVLEFSLVAWVAATASLLAYTHILGGNTFLVPPWATAVQIAAICCALTFGYAKQRCRRLTNSL
jgi:alpha-1,6-mannosyltransferase